MREKEERGERKEEIGDISMRVEKKKMEKEKSEISQREKKREA